MKIYFIVLMSALVSESLQCCDSCCSTSSCQQSCNSCCSSCQKSCYNVGCSTDTCRVGCMDTCRQRCCETAPVRSSTPPAKLREEKDHEHGDSNTSIVVGGSNATNTLTANINTSNIINNNNIINVTVSVNNNIENNISNEGGGGNGRINNGTNVVTVTVPVPVKVVVCNESCTASTPPTTSTTRMPPTYPPYPTPAPNCCMIVVPCVGYNCNPYHHVCGGCQGRYGYLPVNPCGGGCQRRDYWPRERCSFGQCVSRVVDCSYCPYDFYRDYNSYSRCQGCFY